MTTQSWTIGSSPDCQIQIQNETVSGHHCRLTFDGQQITIEDLYSTNGTFVNGKLLKGIQFVSLTDRITLGRSLLLPWPESLQPPDPTPNRLPLPPNISLTIGRDAKNEIVLNESNVSTVHARLTISSNKIILEDLGSTNGTSVGSVEQKIHRAEISMDDTLFFGSTKYSVAELIERAQWNQNSRLQPPESVPQSAGRPRVTLSKSAIASVSISAVLLLGWVLFRGTGNNPFAQTKKTPPQTASSPRGEVDQTSSKQPIVALSSEEQLKRSLFVIVATDSGRETPFRLGTAFAIDAQHVVTTASVISALRDLQQNGFSTAFLYSPSTGEELEIANVVVHPAYQSASKAAQAAQSEYESIMDQYEVEPPSPEELQSVKSKLYAAREQALMAIERETSNDVAVIELKKTLQYWLSVADSELSLRPNLKLKVRGLAFDLEDPYFDPQETISLQTMSSRVQQITRLSPETAPRLLAGGTADQLELAFFGSPALNLQGQVVAIYSRPTPPKTQELTSSPTETYDAPLVDRVRECLNLRP